VAGLSASLAVVTAAVLTTQPAAAVPPRASVEPCVIVMPVDPEQSAQLPELIQELITALTELVGGDAAPDPTGAGGSNCPGGTSGTAGAEPSPSGRAPAAGDPVPAPGGADTSSGGTSSGGTGAGGSGTGGAGAGEPGAPRPGAPRPGGSGTGTGPGASGDTDTGAGAGGGAGSSGSDSAGADGSGSDGSDSSGSGSSGSESDDSGSAESDSGESESGESGSSSGTSESEEPGSDESDTAESESSGSGADESNSGESESGESASGDSGSSDSGSEDEGSENEGSGESESGSESGSDDSGSGDAGSGGAGAAQPADSASDGEQSSGEASATAAGADGKAGVPGDLLSLENWYLTLPVGPAGDPESIDQPELLTYSGEHFELTPEGDGVVFRAHAGGVTTENSSYARSELREMAGGDEKAAWSNTSGTHTLETREAITKTPTAKPEVVAAQIHDGGDDVMQIRLEGQTLVAQYADGDEQIVIDPAYELGTPYDLRIVAANGGITVFYNGKQAAEIPRSGTSWYWKIGAYTQSNPEKGDPPDAVGEVVVYSLAVEHSGT
jgi:hypothetical protein